MDNFTFKIVRHTFENQYGFAVSLTKHKPDGTLIGGFTLTTFETVEEQIGYVSSLKEFLGFEIEEM